MSLHPRIPLRKPGLGDAVRWAFLACVACACRGGQSDGRAPAVRLAGTADLESRVDAEPRRVLSLLPSATELILALGAADRLVGRTTYDHQETLSGLPSVGAPMTPDLERLILLQPDLVIGWPDGLTRPVVDRLAELGIRVYTPATGTIADIYRTAEELGELLGFSEAADSLITAIESGLEAVRAGSAGRPKPKVVYLVWHDPPTVAGPGTYVDELIEIAGGRNVFHDAAGRWPRTSLEALVDRRPDLVLIPNGPSHPIRPERLLDSPAWRRVLGEALDRVAVLQADLFHRPGPRLALAACRLALVLHPEVASDGLPLARNPKMAPCAC